jgi:hypothetical protein
MPIDVGIYQNALRAPRSVADYDAEYAQGELQKQNLQQNALALQTGQMGLAEKQRALQEAGILRNALMGLGAGATDEQRIGALKATGLPGGFTQADALQKAIIEQRKGNAAAGKDEAQTAGYKLDQSVKAHEFHVQQLAQVNDPQGAVQWAQAGLKSGVFTPEQFQRGMQALQQASQTPQAFAQWKQQAMQGGASATEQLRMQADAAKQAEAVRQFGVTSRETARGHDITMRGQNMADARARESTAATMTKPFEVTGPDGTPMLVQQDRQGNITPVQGFGPKAGAAKPLNDSQAKALLFGSRMQESDKILADLSAKGTDTPSLTKEVAESVPLIGGALGAAANYAASPDQQSAEQAQRDFVNAVLRRESGAAISPSEFDSAKKQYFNARGDSAQVKAQKAANRQLAIKGLLAEVPVGQRGSISTPSSQAAGAANVVRTPDGQTHTFPTAEAAARFKQAAGL